MSDRNMDLNPSKLSDDPVYDESPSFPILTPASILANANYAQLINPEEVNPDLKVSEDFSDKAKLANKKRWRDTIINEEVPIFWNEEKDIHSAKINENLSKIRKEEEKDRHVIALIDAPQTVIMDIIKAAEEISPVFRDRCITMTMVNRVYLFFRTAAGKINFINRYNPDSGFGTIEYTDPEFNPSDEEIHTCITYVLNDIPPAATKIDINSLAKDHGAAHVIFEEDFIRAAFNSKSKAKEFEEKANKGELSLLGKTISAKYISWGEEKGLTLWFGYARSELAHKVEFWEAIITENEITGVSRITPIVNRLTNRPSYFAFVTFESHVAMNKVYSKLFYFNRSELKFNLPKKPINATVCKISLTPHTNTPKNNKLQLIFGITSTHITKPRPSHLFTLTQKEKKRQTNAKEKEFNRQQLSNPIPVAKPAAIQRPPTSNPTTTTTTTTSGAVPKPTQPTPRNK